MLSSCGGIKCSGIARSIKRSASARGLLWLYLLYDARGLRGDCVHVASDDDESIVFSFVELSVDEESERAA